MIGFAYEDTLPAGHYDLMKNQHGWKARITNARVEYVDLPSDGGVGKGLSLYGDLEQVEFVYDPGDTLGISIQWHSLR